MSKTEFEPLPWFHSVKSEFHPNENHNYWAKKKIPCPYCLLGSKPVPKAFIVERLEHR